MGKSVRRVKRVTIFVACSVICLVILLGIGLSMMLASGQPDAVWRFQSQENDVGTPYGVYDNGGYDVPWVAQNDAQNNPQNGAFVALGDEPIVPIPPMPKLNDEKVALGDRLFHDAQLSGNETIACASCHQRSLGGADGHPLSVGMEGHLLRFNAPTVWNSSLNFRQFWDGRAATLEAQVDEPILNPDEMNASWSAVLAKLSQDAEYVAAFERLYDDRIQPDFVRDAIATYERSLLTPNAKFDQYLQGDLQAISPTEQLGYQRFKDYGCVACHQGVNIGGNMYQRLGVMQDFFAARGEVTTADLGRMNISGRARDRYVFKVPSLRNVTLTSPYLHDGSIETLEEVVRIMGQYQLGREIPAEDVRLIVQFLHTLTGQLEDA